MIKENKKVIESKFETALAQISRGPESQIKQRDELLRQMGINEKKIKKIPKTILNYLGPVINPYFVAKLHSERGIPKEITLEILKEKGYKEEWNDWCDFWFNSFTKIPHNILCNSKEYFKNMGWI